MSLTSNQSRLPQWQSPFSGSSGAAMAPSRPAFPLPSTRPVHPATCLSKELACRHDFNIPHLNGQSKPALRDGAPQGSRATLHVYGLRQVGAGDQYWPPGRPHCAFPDRFVTCRAFRPPDDELGNCWVTGRGTRSAQERLDDAWRCRHHAVMAFIV